MSCDFTLFPWESPDRTDGAAGLLLNDQNRKVGDSDDESCAAAGKGQCIMDYGVLRRSFVDITSQRTNEFNIFRKTFYRPTLTTPRPSLHKDTLLAPSHLACVPELSSLVYIFIYLNFPHLTTFYFPPTTVATSVLVPFRIAQLLLFSTVTLLYFYFPVLCGRLEYLYLVCEKVRPVDSS